MNEKVGSIQSSQPGKFEYYPAVGSYMPDYDNIDMSSAYNTYPAMGMNGSIFGPVAGMGMGTYNPYMPYAPMFGMGDRSYFDNMKKYQKNWSDYYVDSQRLQRNSDLKINGAMEAVEETAANLKDKINHNEQDQIQAAYQKYLEAVRNAYGNASEEELNSRALALYTQLNGGTSIVQDLRNNGHSSFLQGFIQSLTFGTYGKKSAEDNIAEITNQEVPTGEKAEQNAGRLTGIAALGAGTAAIAKGILRAGAKKAGFLGVIAAGAVAAVTLLTSKVTT